MTTLNKLFRYTLLLFCICLYISCSATNTKSEIVLIGCTPGDELVKTMLAIPSEAKIDFIRWNLILNENNSFILDINYGESQPNALGFKANGKKTTIKGTFSVSESSNYKEVYHLKSADISTEILIVKLNENIFHLLSSQHQMMVGNGGWSYTLNRKEPIPNEEISIISTITDDKSLQLVYDGRTPCQEIGNEHPEMKVTPSCFKIKWRLILNRDAVTYKPTTCTIRNIVNNQPRDISGKWEIVKGTKTNPNAIIYKITVNNLSEPILLFAAEDNVLFFIDKDKKPMKGNKDFSFTLNKKSQ
jgi:hypothetical protein